MSEEVGYVVIEFNQASHEPAVLHGDVWLDKADAQWQLNAAQKVTREVGRRERYAIGTVYIEEEE